MKKPLPHIYHNPFIHGKHTNGQTAFFASPGGFTTLELVAVLLIVMILATVAIPRHTEIDQADAAAADTLKSHLRYAHLRAMGDTVPWGIAIGSNSYTLRKNGSPVPLPGKNSATKTFENISGISGPDIYFSSERGIPVDSSGAPVGTNQTITIGAETITVTEFTGFIP